MTSHSGLLACSNEVLTVIFSDPDLNKKDIKALRLTCKELHPAATREFAMRYLAEPYFVLTRESLRALVDICRHPLFSPHIRSIGFIAIALGIDGLSNRVDKLRDTIIQDHMNDKLASRLASISEYAALCNEQAHLRNSGDGFLSRPCQHLVAPSVFESRMNQILSTCPGF